MNNLKRPLKLLAYQGSSPTSMRVILLVASISLVLLGISDLLFQEALPASTYQCYEMEAPCIPAHIMSHLVPRHQLV